MLKIILMVCLLGLSACTPYINAGNKNMVTLYVPDTSFESEALDLADQHCGQYGMTAKLRKPRSSDSFGQLYDYNCVK